TDIVVEALFAVLMLVTAVVTAGAATAAVGAIGAAVEAGVEVTAGAVANATAAAVGAVANATAGVTGALLTVNDTVAKTGGKGFLSDSQRDVVSQVNSIATTVAVASGLVQGVSNSAMTALRATTAENEISITTKTQWDGIAPSGVKCCKAPLAPSEELAAGAPVKNQAAGMDAVGWRDGGVAVDATNNDAIIANANEDDAWRYGGPPKNQANTDGFSHPAA